LPTAPAEPDSFEVQEEGAEESAAPAAQTVAGVYRALRKAREDSKDASGASDFYYGEMEMRRKHERGALLLVYWLLSGYGTRAGRALLAYGAVVGLIGLLLHSFGFEGVRLEREAASASPWTNPRARTVRPSRPLASRGRELSPGSRPTN
jgi:hypothetical protein